MRFSICAHIETIQSLAVNMIQIEKGQARMWIVIQTKDIVITKQSHRIARTSLTIQLIVKVAFQRRQNFFAKQKKLNNPHWINKRRITFIVWTNALVDMSIWLRITATSVDNRKVEYRSNKDWASHWQPCAVQTLASKWINQIDVITIYGIGAVHISDKTANEHGSMLEMCIVENKAFGANSKFTAERRQRTLNTLRRLHLVESHVSASFYRLVGKKKANQHFGGKGGVIYPLCSLPAHSGLHFVKHLVGRLLHEISEHCMAFRCDASFFPFGTCIINRFVCIAFFQPLICCG